jgi:hypothetical protein
MGKPPLPVISVAGYLFESEAYIRLRDGINDLLCPLGIKYFRMYECNGASGQFAGMQDDACLDVEKAVIRMIRETAILGVSVSLSEATHRLMSPVAHEEHPYNMLCQWCMWEIGKWADRNAFNGTVTYNFESGHAAQRCANAALNNMEMDASIKQACRYGSHLFIDKKKERGLQVADLLAWFQRREGERERAFARRWSTCCEAKRFSISHWRRRECAKGD